jgi:hypothetical protein
MPPKIKHINADDDYRLLITFDNGIKKIYNFSQKFIDDRYQLLKNLAFFKSVQIEPGGYGLYWNDDIDISENELWEKSEIHQPQG